MAMDGNPAPCRRVPELATADADSQAV